MRIDDRTLTANADYIDLGNGTSVVRVNGSLIIMGDTRIAVDAMPNAENNRINDSAPFEPNGLKMDTDASIEYYPEDKILQIDAERVHLPCRNLTAGLSDVNLFDIIESLMNRIALLESRMEEMYYAPGMPGGINAELSFWERNFNEKPSTENNGSNNVDIVWNDQDVLESVVDGTTENAH